MYTYRQTYVYIGKTRLTGWRGNLGLEHLRRFLEIGLAVHGDPVLGHLAARRDPSNRCVR